MSEQGFRVPEVCRLVGISYRQLDYWARTELVTPSIRDAHGSGTQRLYSFQDLVTLRVIKSLLDTGDLAAAGPRGRRVPAGRSTSPRTGSPSSPTARASTRPTRRTRWSTSSATARASSRSPWTRCGATSRPRSPKAAKKARDGRRRVVSSAAARRPRPTCKSDTVGFAHASERQFARLLDFYGIEWEYEPTSFDIDCDTDGTVVGPVHARLLPAGLRPLHRDHHAEPEARHEEEPQGPPAPRAVPRGQVQGLLPARLPVPGDQVRPGGRVGLTTGRCRSDVRPYTGSQREVRTAHRRRRPRDARALGLARARRPVRPDPAPGPPRPAARDRPTGSRRWSSSPTCGRSPPATAAPTISCASPAAAPTTTTSPARVGPRRAQRVLDLLHPVPAGALPGRPAGAVRVPVDDLRAHRPRGLQRLALRRRHRARRGRAHVARRRARPGPGLRRRRSARYVETLRTYGRGAGYEPEVFDLEGGRGGAPGVHARRRRRRRAAPEPARDPRAGPGALRRGAATGARARSRCSTRCRSACSRRRGSSAPTSRSRRASRSATT